MAAYITVGAKTSHGGTVISGSPHTTHNGIPISRKGDKVICKKCKKVTTILSGDASFIVDGAPIARGGDVTSCGAKLIASQQSFAESGFEVMGVEQAAPLVFAKSEPDALFGNSFVEDDEEPTEDDYVVTNLGDEVDKIAADSPTLQENIKDLQEAGWEIKYGPAEEGTYTDTDQKLIVIAEDQKGDSIELMDSLTHEVGHAIYKGKDDYSNKVAYVNSQLKHEGAATIHSMKIREELINNGGPDIGSNLNPDDLQNYQSIYNKYGNTDKSYEKTGEIYKNHQTSNTGQYYEDYYGEYYDEYYD